MTEAIDDKLPAISPLNGDAHIQYSEWIASVIECASKAYGSEHDGGLYELGILDDPVSWAARHPTIVGADGIAVPGQPFPPPMERPVDPGNASQLAFSRFLYFIGIYNKRISAVIRFNNALQASLGPERCKEIKSFATGMAHVTPRMIVVFYRERYGTMTMAKLLELKSSIQHLGGKSAQAFFAHTDQVHELLEVNGQGLSQLLKLEYAQIAIEGDNRLHPFLIRYNDENKTMASRSYIAMKQHVLACDAAAPTADRAANNVRTLKTSSAMFDAEAYSSEQVDEEFEDGYGDGFLQGVTAGNVHKRRNGAQNPQSLEDRMDSMEAALRAMTVAFTQATGVPSPSVPGLPAKPVNYCFVHGSGAPHQSNGCFVMRKDTNYTDAMKKASKKCTLIANDGTSITGAD